MIKQLLTITLAGAISATSAGCSTPAQLPQAPINCMKVEDFGPLQDRVIILEERREFCPKSE